MRCEFFANVYLPAIRAILARELLKKGFSRKEIADLLYLSKPAITMYLKKHRGKAIEEIENNEKLFNEIKKTIEDLSSGKINKEELEKRYCEFCKLIWNFKI